MSSIGSPDRRKNGTALQSIVERPPQPETKRPREYLADTITHPHFMKLILILAIIDALFCATSLTADILAIKSESKLVCDTREVLELLYDRHRGELDYWFETHTNEEIIDEIRHRGGEELLTVKKYKREIRDTALPRLETSTLPNLDRDSDHGNTDITDNAHNKVLISSELYHVAYAFRYASLVMLLLMFIIKIVRIYALGAKFFHSKLQSIDALVIVISLPLDIVFLPVLYGHTDAMHTSLPIIYDITSRVVRVVINCLIQLHEHDKVLLAQEKRKLKLSNKRYKVGKRQVKKLRELATNLGAEMSQVLACSKKAVKKKSKLKKHSLLSGLLEAHKILFLASPDAPINPNIERDVVLKTEESVVDKRKDSMEITPPPKRRADRLVSLASSIGSLGSEISSFDSEDEDDTISDEMMDSGSSEPEDDIEQNEAKISNATIITYM